MNSLTVEEAIKQRDNDKKKIKSLNDSLSKLKSKYNHQKDLLMRAQLKIDGHSAELDRTRMIMIDTLQSLNYVAKSNANHGQIMITAIKLLDYDQFWRDRSLKPVTEIMSEIQGALLENGFNQLTLKYRY